MEEEISETPKFWKCGCRNHIEWREEPGDIKINLTTGERTIVPPRPSRGFTLPQYRGRGRGYGSNLYDKCETIEKKLEVIAAMKSKKNKKDKKKKG